MNRLPLFIPFALCLALGTFLFFSLDKDPLDLPSALVGEPFPAFALEDLSDPQRQLSSDDFDGQVVLVNVWATWCFACRIEHPWLNSLAAEGVKIIGLNYKDYRELAQAWLQERGDPYQFSIFDPRGTLGIDLGVYGAPETYLVDAEGIIRHRRVGVVDERVWNEEFRDLYKQLVDAANAQ
ncbi:DsbE family thiol:disulfide interchange protein [bacterium]|nr:DsbE family thiol:disulfide interchange protein [bacterium]